MFFHQRVARVQVFADIQNFAPRAHCLHGIPFVNARRRRRSQHPCIFAYILGLKPPRAIEKRRFEGNKV